MSQRSAIQLELYEQCHSPSYVLIESRRLLIWVKSKSHYALLHALLQQSSGYIQRLTAYELNGLSI